MSSWKIIDETLLRDAYDGAWTNNMLAKMSSLNKITLGNECYFADGAVLDGAGSQVGTRWMQVNLGKGGTRESPKGKVFESPSGLFAIHCDRTKRKTDTEEYIRVAPAKLTVTFTKGADDVAGEMAPPVYDVDVAATLSKHAYKRAGYHLSAGKIQQAMFTPTGNLLKTTILDKRHMTEKYRREPLSL